MPSKLIVEVADYCWSKNFLDIFRNFFAEHGGAFENAPPLAGGEHNLEYYSLFQIYLKLYETTLEKYLNTLDCSIEEFYRDVRDAQDSTDDPYLMTFIDCLLASADYDSFYKVMAREGQRSVAKKTAAAGKLPSPPRADAKAGSSGRMSADSKGLSPSAAGSKAGADYEDDDRYRGDNNNSSGDKKLGATHK